MTEERQRRLTELVVRLERHLISTGRDEAIMSARGYCALYKGTAYRDAGKRTRDCMVKDVFRDVAALVTESAIVKGRDIGVVPVNDEALARNFVVPDDIEQCKRLIRPGRNGYAGIYITKRSNGAMLLAYTQNQRAQARGKMAIQDTRENGFDAKKLLSDEVKLQLVS